MNLEDVFNHAMFANASYAPWDTSNTSLATAGDLLENEKRIPKKLFESRIGSGSEFPWSIPSFYPADTSGFAANVFANGNRKVLAIRGTETNDAQIFLDVVQADLLEIGMIGVSLTQLTSLVNYIQRLRAPAGAPNVPQFTIRMTDTPPLNARNIAVTLRKPALFSQDSKVVYYWLETRLTGRGEGVLNSGDEVTVTGHSLGGHLAAAALRLFPQVFQAAVTFNAANFDPIAGYLVSDGLINALAALSPSSPVVPYLRQGYTAPQQATESLLNALFAPQLTNSSAATSFAGVASRIHNLRSEDSVPGNDVEIISGALSGTAPSAPQPLRTEMNSHSMDQMLDSMAAFALLERLNPALAPSALHALFDAASADPADSLERLVMQLNHALTGNKVSLDTVASGILGYPNDTDLPDAFARRTAIHERIVALDALVMESAGVSLDSLLNYTAEALATRAATSAAHRFALVEAMPFAVTGNVGIAGNSPPLDAARFSPEFLRARAEYLLAESARRMQDRAHAVFGAHPQSFIDKTTDTRLHVVTNVGADMGLPVDFTPAHTVVFGTAQADPLTAQGASQLFGQDGADVLLGSEVTDLLDGGAENDTLEGGAGSDRLVGGTGDDVLYGATAVPSQDLASDELRGGDGFDRYYAAAGDRIQDRDGELHVLVGNQYLRASRQALRTLYLSPELELYQAPAEPELWYVHAPMTGVLRVNGVIVENFRSGDLGIVLGNDRAFLADGVNKIGTPDHDALTGTDGAEWLWGLAGDDVITARDGDDRLEGGEGIDFLYGGAGHDELYDEAGESFLFGESGDDYLDGKGGRAALSGGDDHDVLLGSAFDDVLFGGLGHDLLRGGDGADFLHGSATMTAASRYWTRKTQPAFFGLISDPRAISFDGIRVSDETELNAPLDPAWDTIYGEDGDDDIIGSGGDDWIDGGEGSDAIAGGDGDDFIAGGGDGDDIRGGGGGDSLYGGDGDDEIVGGGGDESWSADLGDRIYGGRGEDQLFGMEGDDKIDGEEDNDLLYGEAGSDQLNGGLGDDRLFGGRGHDILRGGAGADALQGDADNDALFGDDGSDKLDGGAGDDQLHGGAAADELQGGNGADALFGDDGDDELNGQSGADVLDGGRGQDVTMGGDGNDWYLYRRGDGHDRIDDTIGDNGLYLVDGLTPRDASAQETGKDLIWRFSATDAITFTDWRAPQGIAYVRFGADSYLPREHFLMPQMAGSVVTLNAESAPLVGTAGDDLVVVRTARADLNAQGGDDRYVIEQAGDYRLDDAVGHNTLQFAAGARFDALEVQGENGRYIIHHADTTVSLQPGHIHRFVFDDGVVLSGADFDARFAQLVDPAPRVQNAATDQGAFVASEFEYVLPDEQFVDFYPNDTLRRSITLKGGGALPTWLTFDEQAGTFRGTPLAPGTFEIEIRATDLAGQQALDSFAIDVLPTLGGGKANTYHATNVASSLQTWIEPFAVRPAPIYLMGVGDLNHDGRDDVLEPTSGRIVFGRQEGFGASFSIPPLTGYNGFQLTNYSESVLSGDPLGLVTYVPRRGDFNGDGIDDVVLGNRVLYGRIGRFPANVDYAALAQATALGTPSNSKLPSVQSAQDGALPAWMFQEIGDFNGDGHNDYYGTLSAERGVVIYGIALDANRQVHVDGLAFGDGMSVHYSAYPGMPNQLGLAAVNYAGWGTNVKALGDVNGDGFADFGIGSSPYLFQTQNSYLAILLGAATGHGGAVSLNNLSSQQGLLAAVPETWAGVAYPKFTAALGDVNGDRFDDVLIGSAGYPTGSYILYGRESLSGAASTGTFGRDTHTVNVGVSRSQFYGGLGDDQYILQSSSGRHFANGGAGNDRYTLTAGIPGSRATLHISDAVGQNTLFVPTAARGRVTLSRGSVAIDLGEDLPLVHLDDVDYNNPLGGARSIDTIEFADGTVMTYAELLARGFDVNGGSVDDDLLGTGLDDRLNGFEGHDRLAGGNGNDVLNGGSGDDLYVVAAGEGNDLIVDSAGSDTLQWGSGIALSNLTKRVVGSDLLIDTPQADVLVSGWYNSVGNQIEQFSFANGSTVDARRWANSAPVVIAPTGSSLPQATVNKAYFIKIPAWIFKDIDPGDKLSYSLSTNLATAWLRISPDGTLFGVPLARDAGKQQVQITARDRFGATASAKLQLNVYNTGGTLPTSGNDLLRGSAGDDTLYALAGDDTLDGLGGNDLLYGEAGNDILIGAGGNDSVVGGFGNDRYRFGRGSGADTFYEYAAQGLDTVEFDGTVRSSDIAIGATSGGYELSILGTADKIRLAGKVGVAPEIEEYRFTDGTRWLAADIVRLAQSMASFTASTASVSSFSAVSPVNDTLQLAASSIG